MAKHVKSVAEQSADHTLDMKTPLLEVTEDAAADNGDHGMGHELAYTDKKGHAWRRLMAQRFPKAQRMLERLITLGTWVNYHYTQREAKAVCDKLRAIIDRIERAHQRNATAEEDTLKLPWED